MQPRWFWLYGRQLGSFGYARGHPVSYEIDSTFTLNSVDDKDFGYLRVVVNSTTMTIEFHPESDGGVTKTPDDM